MPGVWLALLAGLAAAEDSVQLVQLRAVEEDLIKARDDMGLPRHLNEFVVKLAETLPEQAGMPELQRHCGGIFYEAYYYVSAPRKVRNMLELVNTNGKPLFRNEEGCHMYFDKQDEGGASWSLTYDGSVVLSQRAARNEGVPMCGGYRLNEDGDSSEPLAEVLCQTRSRSVVHWETSKEEEGEGRVTTSLGEDRAPRICLENKNSTGFDFFALSKEDVEEIVVKPGHMKAHMWFGFTDPETKADFGIRMTPARDNQGFMNVHHEVNDYFDQWSELSLRRSDGGCDAYKDGQPVHSFPCPGGGLKAKVYLHNSDACIFVRAIPARADA